MKIRNLCVIVILLTTVSLVTVEGTTVSRLFNSNQIEDALQKRATYFSTTKITFDSMPISNWNKTRKENALQSINANPEAESPWYHLLNGFIENSYSDSVRDAYFNEALSIANEDAGTTWLLFLEFLRNNETIWYERSLEQLEKLMFLSGASSSKLLSQQLLHIALVQENFRNKNIAEIFYSWAHRFNKNESISIHRRFWINFPRKPDQCFKYSATYFHQLKKTWPMQLELSKALYAWFRMIFIFFALSIVLTLLVKNLPTSLHSLADKMPSGVNLTLKTILISATAGSFVFLGLYPFLWASAFLIHNQITLKDKKFLFLALVILTLAPFDTFFQNCLNRAANPEKPLLIFSQAITEGRSESLYKSALQNSQNDSTDYLSPITTAIYAIKSGDYATATNNIRKIYQQRQDDPVLLITIGNLHFLQNNYEKAQAIYKQMNKAYPNSYIANFNLAQCYLKQMESVAGTELLNEVSKSEPEIINSFINLNDSYFSNNWPSIRTIMFADYSPKMFWTKHFPRYAFDWKSASDLWGNTFYGIPLSISALVITLLFLTISILIFIPQSKRKSLKKIFECRFCGRIICRKCQSGILCKTCYELTQYVGSNRITETTRLEIWNKNQAIRSIQKDFFDIIFPGTGMLATGDKTGIKIFITLLTTAIFYASYHSVFISQGNYQHGFDYKIIVLLFIPVTYNFYFAVKRIIRIADKFQIFSADPAKHL